MVNSFLTATEGTFPFKGTWRVAIWSLHGRRPRASCQVKILILKGMGALQMSFASRETWPWQIFLYKECTENCPEGSMAQDTLSWSSEGARSSISWCKACHCRSSSGPNALRKERNQPVPIWAWETKISETEQMLNKCWNHTLAQ